MSQSAAELAACAEVLKRELHWGLQGVKAPSYEELDTALWQILDALDLLL